ncbi:MAG TPA: aldo/keto reductase [Microthrixaceae bacterium]|nr:aldo/keto reductase [Microthrixaceae bacterium]HMT23286.1 aldo/keto reductase [Microthrixaceae bacterium]
MTDSNRFEEPARRLAGIDASVVPLGLGTWAWGDRKTWGMGGYDSNLTESTIRKAWDRTLQNGPTLIDTAEVYGSGESERIIGRLLAATPHARSQIVLATKWWPAPWRLDVTRSVRSSLEASLTRLGVDHVDLYQVHGPISLRGAGAIADAFAAVVDAGLARAVGASNYSQRETQAIIRELASRGLPLSTNQVEMSLLRRRPESSGLLDLCRAAGVTVLAYSPLGQGRLTGKYSAASPPPKGRGFSAHPMAEVDRVVAVLREVGEHHDRPPAAVALRWLIDKGAVPIPGAKNDAQAAANAQALGWTLPADALARLDSAALHGRRTLGNRLWQHD